MGEGHGDVTPPDVCEWRFLMQLKRKSALWSGSALLLAATMTLAGCASDAGDGGATEEDTSGSAETEEATDEPVTVRVQFEVPEDGPDARAWQAVADAFEEKYPNVTVQLEGITNEAKGGPNLQVLTSSDAPDIALVPLNSNVYTQMLAANQLVALNDIFEEDNYPERLGPPAAALLQADGNYYAGPNTVAYYNILWTNPDALAAAGVEIPENKVFESPEALIEAGQACSAAGYAGVAIGGSTNYQASWMFDAALPTAVPEADFSNYLQSWRPSVDVTADYTAPGVVEALDVLGRYAAEGLYQDGYLGQDAPAAEALFTSGGSCMLLSGSWLPGGTFADAQASGEMTFEPGFAVLPPVSDAGAPARLTPYYGNAYGIPVNASNVEWGKKLLQYYLSDEGQRLGAVEVGGFLPAVTTVDVNDSESFPQLVKDIVAYVEQNGSNSGWTSEVPGAFGQIFLNPLIQQLQEQRITPEEIADLQQAELENVRAAG